MKYNVGNYVKSGTGIYQIAGSLEGEQPILKTMEGELIGFSESVIFEPLPITPEILERLGIHRNPHTYNLVFVVKGMLIGFYGIAHDEIHVRIGNYSKQVQFIHQIQNLYEAIEEKELVFQIEKP